jgi:hypothetical protein
LKSNHKSYDYCQYNDRTLFTRERVYKERKMLERFTGVGYNETTLTLKLVGEDREEISAEP